LICAKAGNHSNSQPLFFCWDECRLRDRINEAIIDEMESWSQTSPASRQFAEFFQVDPLAFKPIEPGILVVSKRLKRRSGFGTGLGGVMGRGAIFCPVQILSQSKRQIEFFWSVVFLDSLLQGIEHCRGCETSAF